ncbi:hypothetical protein FRC02_001695 [Tulasnella sp. 418]|nr:hypothetical protein FRC02_001695 [Tulasnella sp. 418]
MSPRPASPPPDSGWNSIRPYTPRLLLRTCEITSVSATFTISTSLDTTFLKRLNQGHEEPLGDDVPDLETIGDLSSETSKQGIADILGKGLRVKVNSDPWEKVLLHSEEAEEDAVVTLYGLLPSSEYEIELGVVSGEDIIHSTIVTSAPEADVVASNDESDHEQIVAPVPLQTATPETTPPSSPRRPPSPPPPRLITVDERAAQLRRTLAASNEQRDALVGQLKFARKEAQRTDAGLRSEMEALKRTADKNASAEQRNRQKVLALQESIKRLHAGAEEAEAEAAAN